MTRPHIFADEPLIATAGSGLQRYLEQAKREAGPRPSRENVAMLTILHAVVEFGQFDQPLLWHQALDRLGEAAEQATKTWPP